MSLSLRIFDFCVSRAGNFHFDFAALTALGGLVGSLPIQNTPLPAPSSPDSPDSPGWVGQHPPNSKHPPPLAALIALTALTALGRLVGFLPIQNTPGP